MYHVYMGQREQVVKAAEKLGLIRPNDVRVPRVVLKRLVEAGVLEHAGRGLYRLPSSALSAHHSLVEVSVLVPKGIISLLSALQFHEVGTQAPPSVWMTLDVRARKPRLDYPPIEVMRASGQALSSGIEKHDIEGRKVQIYSLEKTIADCFKYRNKIGLDVALEALKDAWSSKRINMEALWRYCRICRVTNVIRPYLEVLQQ